MYTVKIFEGTCSPTFTGNIPIDTQEKYQVEFDAKSTGEVDSKAYFYMLCFDSNE